MKTDRQIERQQTDIQIRRQTDRPSERKPREKERKQLFA